MLLLLAGQVLGQSSEKAPTALVLFSVKKFPIYTDEFIYLYKKNHLSPEDFTEKKIDEYLNLFINFKLKVAEAKSRGLDTTAAFIKEFKSYKEELKKPYLAEKDELDRLTKEAYQRLTEEIKASHILVSVKPDAFPADTIAAYEKIMNLRQLIISAENVPTIKEVENLPVKTNEGAKKINKGTKVKPIEKVRIEEKIKQEPQDFASFARAFSEDPSAKANDGSLGYFTSMQMVYPFEQAAYSLKVGEISQPVRTRFGYHLIKVYDRRYARGEIEVSHIILRTGGGDDKKVKNKIFEIYDQVRGGIKWEDLVKEFSEDQASKDNGGKLRPFGIGALAGVPEFESAAFALKNPGDYSDPFLSAYGWHIVRLERKIPVPPFSDVEAAIKKKVSRDERLQIADKKRLEEKKKQFGLVEFSDVKSSVLKTADTSLQQAKWRYKGDPSLVNQTIFRLNEKIYSAGSFISYVEKNQTVTSLVPGASMIQLYDSFLGDQLTEIEDQKLLAENPPFRNLLTEYKEGILLFTIMEKEVWNKGADDTLAIRKFYNANKSKYIAGDRVHARVFTTTDKDFLAEAQSKVEKGDSLRKDDLKKFKSISPYRNYSRGESKAVDKVSWAIGLHRTESEGNYYLVEIDNLVPPGPRSLEESRAQIVSDRQDSLEKAWIKELKQKYPVKVNSKGKKFVVAELAKK